MTVRREPAEDSEFNAADAKQFDTEEDRSENQADLHDLSAGPDTFMLQVRGKSMIENHIDDGDYVVIRKRDSAQNGERVVAVVDGEVTLKRFFRHKDRIELRPQNDGMASIVVDPSRDIRIEGVLVGVVRKC